MDFVVFNSLVHYQDFERSTNNQPNKFETFAFLSYEEIGGGGGERGASHKQGFSSIFFFTANGHRRSVSDNSLERSSSNSTKDSRHATVPHNR